MKYKLDVKRDATSNFVWNQRINSNLKIVVSDSFNLTKMFTDPTKTNFNFGFMMEYSL
jgi:hypothetical protein